MKTSGVSRPHWRATSGDSDRRRDSAPIRHELDHLSPRFERVGNRPRPAATQERDPEGTENPKEVHRRPMHLSNRRPLIPSRHQGRRATGSDLPQAALPAGRSGRIRPARPGEDRSVPQRSGMSRTARRTRANRDCRLRHTDHSLTCHQDGNHRDLQHAHRDLAEVPQARTPSSGRFTMPNPNGWVSRSTNSTRAPTRDRSSTSDALRSSTTTTKTPCSRSVSFSDRGSTSKRCAWPSRARRVGRPQSLDGRTQLPLSVTNDRRRDQDGKAAEVRAAVDSVALLRQVANDHPFRRAVPRRIRACALAPAAGPAGLVDRRQESQGDPLPRVRGGRVRLHRRSRREHDARPPSRSSSTFFAAITIRWSRRPNSKVARCPSERSPSPSTTDIGRWSTVRLPCSPTMDFLRRCTS